MRRGKKTYPGRTALSFTGLLLVVACGQPSPGPEAPPPEAPAGEPQALTAAPSGVPRASLRMTADVLQPSVHVWAYDKYPSWIRIRTDAIKKGVFAGDTEAPTCYENGGKRAQLAVQTEARFADYVNDGPDHFFEQLAMVLDTFSAEGFAVHLLLSIHDRPEHAWEGVDWPNETWPSSDTDRFVPYQPCEERETPDGICLYDVIFEKFHRPVIQELVRRGLTDKLSVIYVFNEFDYESPPSGHAVWPNCKNPILCRNQALAYTTVRGLRNASLSVQGEVPIGTKLSDFNKRGSAYIPAAGADQLSYLLRDVMGPDGYVLAYDNIWNDANMYGRAARQRLAPFLDMFQDGRMAFGEYAFRCVGNLNEFKEGKRIPRPQVPGLLRNWPVARGANLFALNAIGKKDGCYALMDFRNYELYPGADEALRGLWDQITDFLGTESPTPCN